MARSHARWVPRSIAGSVRQGARWTLYEVGTVTPATDVFAAASGGSAIAGATGLTNAQGEVEVWVTTPRTFTVKIDDNDGTAYFPVDPGTPRVFDEFTEVVEVFPPPAEIALKAVAGDAIQYVTTTGVDTNDGLSKGSAKLTIAAAKAALPVIDGSARGVIDVGGGTFVLPLTGTVIPYGVQLKCAGRGVTIFTYAGGAADPYALSFGNAVAGTALAYGVGGTDFTLMLTNNAGKAITYRECQQMIGARIYIEGPASAANVASGVFVDGCNTADILGSLDTITCNHIKYPFRFGTTGTLPTVAVVGRNLHGMGGAGGGGSEIAGSVIFTFDPSTTDCNIQGNAETADIGVKCAGKGNRLSIRMEIDDAKTNVQWDAGAAGNHIDAENLINPASGTAVVDNATSYPANFVTGTHKDFTTYVGPMRIVGAAGMPAFQNSWVNFGGTYETARFHKGVDGRVTLQGAIKNGTLTNGAFTLPVGCRPAATMAFAVVTDSGHGQVNVNATGTVVPVTGATTFVSLAGITFMADAGSPA